MNLMFVFVYITALCLTVYPGKWTDRKHHNEKMHYRSLWPCSARTKRMNERSTIPWETLYTSTGAGKSNCLFASVRGWHLRQTLFNRFWFEMYLLTHTLIVRPIYRISRNFHSFTERTQSNENIIEMSLISQKCLINILFWGKCDLDSYER